MFDFFEKGFLATVGMMSLTREKTQEMVDELVRRGDLNREEGSRLVDRLVTRGQEEQENFRQMIRQEMTDAMRGMNFATQDDIRALNARLDLIIQKLGLP